MYMFLLLLSVIAMGNPNYAFVRLVGTLNTVAMLIIIFITFDDDDGNEVIF